jgi:DNA-binding MarR family transcriptional regulator
MNTLPKDITESKAVKIGHIIDHLVDALGGEPGCTVRRAVILADIDENPGTTQAEIINRLKADKSTLNRDIEWLYDYGCLRRTPGPDGREVRLQIEGYAKKNLDFALEYFDFSHKSLKNFLIHFINLFGEHKPTLRDVKIISVATDNKHSSRQNLLKDLYGGSTTTENRAINNLIDMGLLVKDG